MVTVQHDTAAPDTVGSVKSLGTLRYKSNLLKVFITAKPSHAITATAHCMACRMAQDLAARATECLTTPKLKLSVQETCNFY
mmetsp:Transcript_17657/g.31956  ORF Transcript_17657/g.31956 Transcript_17657/m.31956 type:complete len:82 (-) Transcript_17657:8-253(-)